LQLLDACANNSGRHFRLEVASREFETDFKKALSKAHPKVQEKLKITLRGWAEGDFKDDPQLALIPGLYQGLRRGGVDFSRPEQVRHVAHENRRKFLLQCWGQYVVVRVLLVLHPGRH